MENIGDKEPRKSFQLISPWCKSPELDTQGGQVGEDPHTALGLCLFQEMLPKWSLEEHRHPLPPMKAKGQAQANLCAGDLGRIKVGSPSYSSFLCRMGTASLGAAPSLFLHSSKKERQHLDFAHLGASLGDVVTFPSCPLPWAVRAARGVLLNHEDIHLSHRAGGKTNKLNNKSINEFQ